MNKKLAWLRKIAVLLILCLPSTFWLSAQDPKKLLEFDAASVRQDKELQPLQTNVPLTGDVYRPTGGTMVLSGVRVFSLIGFAYSLNRDQLVTLRDALPAWTETTSFSIEAKAEDPKVTKDELREMMQSLLKDRFHLVAHQERQIIPVFALAVATPGKLGLGLRVHPATDTSCSNAPALVFTGGAPATSPDGFLLSCDHAMSMHSPDGNIDFTGRNMTMGEIAASVNSAGDLGRPVVDETGLKGKFDFIVKFNIDAPAGADRMQVNGSRAAALQVALKDQLGLNLVGKKAAFSTLVVDRIEHPSEN